MQNKTENAELRDLKTTANAAVNMHKTIKTDKPVLIQETDGPGRVMDNEGEQ